MKQGWKGKVVLVTGAGGFIGSHLAERVLQLGAETRAFVRYTSRAQAGFLDTLDPAVRNSINIIHGDLRDYHAVAQATKGVDVVLHLGALIGIPYSYVHPRETVETNVTGTLNVLMAAREAGAERIVQTSSSEVYGTARYVPMDEAHPLQAQSPYSASKIGSDKIGESFFDSYGLPVVILRPFNTYGPRQSARAVIPTIITQAQADQEIKLGNLTPRRDFTYVTDTVEGFIKAAECEGAVGRTINLGTSTEISIGELVEKIGQILGRKLRVNPDAIRVRAAGSEVERLFSDNRLARELLSWQPQVSLEDGLARTISWIGQNLNLYRVGRYEI
ncbi:MAG: SDR family NAD(P)-dependent oxidoreductase [Chloroflexi bacterium]|nr:SDR family NAD(P)-dependent oxidoreductase [Chloroflexota bacterium]